MTVASPVVPAMAPMGRATSSRPVTSHAPSRHQEDRQYRFQPDGHVVAPGECLHVRDPQLLAGGESDHAESERLDEAQRLDRGRGDKTEAFGTRKDSK